MMAHRVCREAIDYYKPGADASPHARQQDGIAYQQLLEFASARKYYEKAIKANPKYAEAVNNLGTSLRAENRTAARWSSIPEGAAAGAEFRVVPQQSGNGVLRPQKLQGSATDIPAGLGDRPRCLRTSQPRWGLRCKIVPWNHKLHYFVAGSNAENRVERSRCSTFARRSKRASRSARSSSRSRSSRACRKIRSLKSLMATEQKVL